MIFFIINIIIFKYNIVLKVNLTLFVIIRTISTSNSYMPKYLGKVKNDEVRIKCIIFFRLQIQCKMKMWNQCCHLCGEVLWIIEVEDITTM